jgi:hypothetical protein
MLFASNLIMLLILLFENTMSPIKIMAKTVRDTRSAMRVRASLFYDFEEEWTQDVIVFTLINPTHWTFDEKKKTHNGFINDVPGSRYVQKIILGILNICLWLFFFTCLDLEQKSSFMDGH